MEEPPDLCHRNRCGVRRGVRRIQEATPVIEVYTGRRICDLYTMLLKLDYAAL